MNDQVHGAIQSRIDLGKTREQIELEFLASGYSRQEFDKYYSQATDSEVPIIPVKGRPKIWKISLIVFISVIFLLVLAGFFFYYLQISEKNTNATANQSTMESSTASSSDDEIKKNVNTESISDAKLDEVVEQEANEISAKFTNDSGEGIIGFYEAYVEGVKFIEASSTPALTAMYNCLLNVYQNPSYSFTCYVNGIQGVESTPKVSEQSPYLFLTGPAIKHRLIWITSEQIPAATNITFSSEGEDTDSTLFVSEEHREDVLSSIEQGNIYTRHDGRHFLGGYSQQEPSAHMIAYIDLDDPFSKHFYPTVLELRELYSVQELAIEVRHLPLTQLHPNAGKLARASHCAAEQGDDYYWLFIKGVFDDRDGNSAYEMSELAKLIQSLGLDEDDFSACVESGAYGSVVSQQAQNIITTGAMGTPHTIIFNRITGESVPEVIEGARPLSELTAVIDSILDI